MSHPRADNGRRLPRRHRGLPPCAACPLLLPRGILPGSCLHEDSEVEEPADVRVTLLEPPVNQEQGKKK